MYRFHITNLGCKVNYIEMQQLREALCQKGFLYTARKEDCLIGIVNTCTVTHKADKKSLHAIRSYARMKHMKYLFVTGCYAELEADLTHQVKAITQVVPQKDKAHLAQIIEARLNEDVEQPSLRYIEPPIRSHMSKWDAFKRAKNEAKSLHNEQVYFADRKRVFIKIQDGCNYFCSYCRIPFARGAPVSRSYTDILKQVTEIAKRHTSEVVLCGINMGTYRDGNLRFSDLLHAILNRVGTTMVRISSIEPYSLDESFYELLTHPNLAPHLHLVLQGTSNEVLAHMKRRYTLEAFYEMLRRIYAKNEDFSISTDVITGFPIETEAMFEAGIQYLRKCRFSKLHVFPYSARDYTHAQERYTDLSDKVKKKRTQILRSLSTALEKAHYLRLVAKPQRFLLETEVSPKETDLHALREGLRKYGIHAETAYRLYKGTSEYYVKGHVLIPCEADLREGRVVRATLCMTDPAMFVLA